MPTERLWPGLDSDGTSIEVYAEDLVTLVPPSGILVDLVQAAVGAPYVLPEYYCLKKLAGQLLTYDPLALGGDAVNITSVTRVSAALAGQTSPLLFGAVADGVTPCSNGINLAIMEAIAFGYSEVRFPGSLSGGVYYTPTQIFLGGNVALTCDSPSCATISYDSSEADPLLPDYAIVVNGTETTFGGPAQASLVTSATFRNLKLTASVGGGIFFATSINPGILCDGLEFDGIAGKAMYFAQSVYFATLHKCVFERTGGVKVTAYCDGFTAKECAFGSNHDYDLDLECPTFFIDGCFFEGNKATLMNLANVVIRTSDVESGYGTLSNCRFGPEFGAGGGTTTAPYDIQFSNAGTTAKTIRGVRLLNNRHFSCSANEGTRKIAPVLLDAGLGSCSIKDLVVNAAAPASAASPGYSSAYQVVTTDAANVVSNTTFVGNSIDELAMVEPTVRVVFDELAQTSVSYRRVLTGHQIDQWYVVGIDWSDTSYGRIGLEKVYKTDSFPHLSRRVVGVMPITSATDARVHIFTEGSLIRTELNTAAGYVLGDPVFIGADGKLSLTPHGTFRKVVGHMVSLENGCLVRLDFSQPVQWVALPGTSSGRWKAGDEVLSATQAVAGGGGSQYVVRGWKRLTDSNAAATNNTLNTDWVELRTLTGT